MTIPRVGLPGPADKARGVLTGCRCRPAPAVASFVGDLGYYAPGNDLVRYYGDQSYHPGIVVLGHLDGDAAGRLAGRDGAITATVDSSAG